MSGVGKYYLMYMLCKYYLIYMLENVWVCVGHIEEVVSWSHVVCVYVYVCLRQIQDFGRGESTPLHIKI